MAANNRYPLATMDGKYIPLDILKPISSIVKNFTAVATTAEALPAGVEILRIRATQNCWIKFADSVAVAPVSATPSIAVTDTHYLIAGTWDVVSPPALYYSVIRDTVDGILIIEPLVKWAILGLEAQSSNT